MTTLARALASLTLAGTVLSARPGAQAQSPPQDAPAFKFRTGVELINVNATVTDQSRPLRLGPDAGRLPRLRRRAAAGGDAFQRRARAGQPRHRPRHQRQHGRRQDPRRARRARSLPAPAARRRRRSVSLSLRQRARAAAGLDQGQAAASAKRWRGSSRAAAPRSTTPSPKRCSWRSRAAIARRPSSSSPTATTRAATPTSSP